MAITIHQQPTAPNMVNNDLLFVLSSNQITQAQYQYVADIYESGSATLIQRIKQQPNPSGKGVFNVGNILTSNMESDNVWKTQGYATSSECNKNFIVKFGEEFASSPSSSAYLYDGITTLTTGSPAKVGSEFYTITDGLVDYPDAINFNFASGSYYTANSASQYITFDFQHALTTAPETQSIKEGDYLTLSLYNGNMMTPASDIVAQDVYYCQIQWFNSSDANIQNDELHNVLANGGAPRNALGELWSAVAGLQTAGSRLIHFGAGVQNLDNIGIVAPSGWAYYTITFYGQGDDGQENNDGVWASFRFNKTEGDCAYNGVRFAWKNEFGVWDYYTFALAESANNNIERISYEQAFVPYNTTSNSATYNKARRGATQIVNKVNRVKTANSDWLTQSEADWLRELFFSTNVYIQDGDDFLPCVINDATLNEKTNPRTQKVFQYSINFELANNKRNRR